MPKIQLDEKAKRAIEEIIEKGNDAIVRKKGGGYIVLEGKKSIKYSTLSCPGFLDNLAPVFSSGRTA